MKQKEILNALQILSRERYFEIVKYLPSDIKTLMRKMKISKMPINRRVNELERVGIVKRIRGIGRYNKGSIELTEFGKEILKMVEIK